MVRRQQVMDQLRYDLGRLITQWRGQLQLLPDTTEEKRAERRILFRCIGELHHVITKNIWEE